MGGGTSPDMAGSKNPDRRYELYKIKKGIPFKPSTASVVGQNKPYAMLLFHIWKLYIADGLGRLCMLANFYREYQWLLTEVVRELSAYV